MDVECPQGRLTEYNVMDDCGAVLHNIETKWLYDFLTLEKCRNFSQAAVSRNVSQPAFSRRIRALEQAIGVELFNRQVTPLQLSEQGKIFHSQIRHLLQQLESNLAELRGGSDYAQRKIKIAAAHSLSLGLLPSIISQMPPLFTWAIEAIDVDEAVDKLREGQSDCIFSFHDEDLLEAPFDHIRLFESQLFPVCASDEHGEALFNLAQPHFPLLNYSRNSYMGRLINRTLTRHSELSFSTCLFDERAFKAGCPRRMWNCLVAGVCHPTRNSQRAARCTESGRTGDPDSGLCIPDEYPHESSCRTLLA